jgi:hypothetical protein
LLIEGNHAVFGEQAAGGGICAKPKIDELIKNNLNKIKGVKKAAAVTSLEKTPLVAKEK